MKLITVSDHDGSVRELANGLNFETAYEFIAENDTDFDNPKWPDCDLILVDGDEEWIFEAESWFQIK
jgi:hypothetical protein